MSADDKDAHLRHVKRAADGEGILRMGRGHLRAAERQLEDAHTQLARACECAERMNLCVSKADEDNAQDAVIKMRAAMRAAEDAALAARKGCGAAYESIRDAASMLPGELSIDKLFPAKEEGTLFG